MSPGGGTFWGIKMRHSFTYLKAIITSGLAILFLSNCGPVSFSTKGSSFSVDPNNGATTPATPIDEGGTTEPSVTPQSNTRDVVLNKTVQPYDNQVDILLVVDDSNSMLQDNLKLAQRLGGFVQNLTNSGLNWQMCTTNTSPVTPQGSTTPYYGYSFMWSLNSATQISRVMSTATSNKAEVFKYTIENVIGAGWENTNDERGILAASRHLSYRPYNNCYRSGAAQAVIIISDEDERSIGGDSTQAAYIEEQNFLTLEAEDQPANYVSAMKAAFGNSKKLTVNSIIVKPGDTACKTAQDAQVGEDGTTKVFSHYGTKYAELSQLTNGAVGSICDTDYSSNLNYFKEKIQNSMAQVALECAPVGAVSVNVSPTIATPSYRVDGSNLIFEPAIPENYSITVNYKCQK